MARMRELESQAVPVALRCILHDCPHCGNAVPINGLVSRTKCTECQQLVEIPAELWHAVLRVQPSTLAKVGGDSAWCQGAEVKVASTPLRMKVERQLLRAPLCAHCGEPLPAGAAEWSSLVEAQATCAKCGRETAFSAPALAEPRGGVPLLSVAALERDADAATMAANTGTEPVAMSCPSCGGHLEVAADSQRTTRCAYCSASVFIPDDLWRILHPIKTARRWTLMYNLTPEQLRKEARDGVILALILAGLFLLLPAISAAVGVVAAIGDQAWGPVAMMSTLLGALTLAFLVVVVLALAGARRYHALARRLDGLRRSRMPASDCARA